MSKSKKRATSTQGTNAKVDSLAAFTADGTDQLLTTNQGVKINDNQNSLKAGERGGTLLEDFILREKITHFDHERIPERIVHARGSAAHGVFQGWDHQGGSPAGSGQAHAGVRPLLDGRRLARVQ